MTTTIRMFQLAIVLMLIAGTARADDWATTTAKARGQTVYWNAWAGDETINDYIAWAGRQVEVTHGIKVVHVKITDTASVVARVLAEKSAGRSDGGSVDLVWINGENFAAMKRNRLLHGPFSETLPNYRHVDTVGKPTTRIDFTIPVDGLEAPWGMAQFVFVYDTATLPKPPKSMTALAQWVAANPGRFTYPKPPDYIGSTFLKQALVELSGNAKALSRPAAKADVATVTKPLWDYLDALHPHLWRGGRAFPANGPAQTQLLADGEVDIALTFNPASASTAIAKGQLPDTVRTFVLDGGTIGNTHFVAIPFNATAKEGAMVLADFLMSPEAQLRKQDPRVWGDPTVLDTAGLPAEYREAFQALPYGIATLRPDQLGTVIPEPHPSWMVEVEKAWAARYAQGN